MTPIMHALHNNTTVKTLVINQRIWDPLELREFVRCLAGINQGIDKIILQAHDFALNFIESLTKILKSNRLIKTLEITGGSSTQINEQGVFRLCDGMDYYHFEEFIINYVPFSAQLYKILMESLKYNQSVKIIRFIADVRLMGDHISHAFNTLCSSLLANPTITDFGIEQILLTEQNCQNLNQILLNTIKALNFKGMKFTDALKFIAEELKVNTSVRDLTFQQCHMDWKLLGEILDHNKTITSLDISESSNNQILDFNFVANRSIRKLSMRIVYMEYKTFIRIIKALKRNKSILELNITNLKTISLELWPSNASDIDDIILDLLNTNKTLRHITGADDYPHLAERLKSNRDAQDKIIDDTCTLIKMIVIKPHSFILPIELWLKIFSYVSYDCTPFNFELFFRTKICEPL